MKNRVILLLISAIIYCYSSLSHAVLIGDKDWNQLWGGPYSSVSTWVEMAVIFDPMTGKCISNLCRENEYWASTTDIVEMYDIAGPNGFSGFSDTFGEAPFFSVIHGVLRDISIRDSQTYITEAFISCNTSIMLDCASPEIFGSGYFSLTDDFSFAQGVYIGVWTYQKVEQVSAPAMLFSTYLSFALILLIVNDRNGIRRA